MTIVFRVDGFENIGLGHIMRCLTLAKQASSKNNIIFLCCALPDEVASLIKDIGAKLLAIDDKTLPSDCDDIQRQHALACLKVLNAESEHKPDILVVDHYMLSAPFSRAMRTCINNIIVIDDLANRVHDCDVLIDQNLYNDMDSRYTGLLPAHTHTFLGPKYALLRKEFYFPPAEKRRANHLLVCFGGSDPANLTERVVDILIELKTTDYVADIVVGAAYKNIDQLAKKLIDNSKITLHHNTPSLSKLMQRGSFMIGAGGTMHWERAKSSLAGLIVTLADNQIETTRCMHEQKCCIWIGDSSNVRDSEIRKAIEFAINSPQEMRKIADNAYVLIGKEQHPSFVMDEILSVIKR